MSLHLITGFKGSAHITSADQGAFNASVCGAGDYVLESGNKLSASVISNNLIRILDGDILMQGRHICLKRDTYEEVSISNGLQGLNRNDLIVARYTKDANTGVEDVSFVVLQGVSTEGKASDPEHTVGDIFAGDILHEMPLYRVSLTGLNVEAVVPLFSTITSMEILKRSSDAMESMLGKTDISKIGNGTVTGGLNTMNEQFAVYELPKFSSANVDDITEYLNNGCVPSKQGVYYRGHVNVNVVCPPVNSGGSWYLEGFTGRGNYQWQRLTTYGGNGLGVWERAKMGADWGDWIALHSKYLLASGGTVDGIVTMNKQLRIGGGVSPVSDNSQMLGSGNFAWSNVVGRIHSLYSNNVNYGSVQIVNEGTSTTTGTSALYIGNGITRGTAGNARGVITMYGVDSGRTQLTPSNNTSNNIEILLPSASGTLLRKEDFTYSDGVLTLTL